MCEARDTDETPHGRRVLDGRWCDAYLGRYPLRPGYCFVVWKGRHVAEPTELSTEEAAGFWTEVDAVGVGHRAARPPATQDELDVPGQRRAAPPRAPRTSSGRRPAGRRADRRRRLRAPARPTSCRPRSSTHRQQHCAPSLSEDISYAWRGPLTDAEMVDLVDSHGGRSEAGWWDRIRPYSLGWVSARPSGRPARRLRERRLGRR